MVDTQLQGAPHIGARRRVVVCQELCVRRMIGIVTSFEEAERQLVLDRATSPDRGHPLT
jgi:hypothetical protein